MPQPIVQTNKSDFTIAVGSEEMAVRRLCPGAAPDTRPTLVFLHEGLGCIDMWRDVPDALVAATGCPALVYDRSGHGRSPVRAAPRGPAYFETEANAVLPALLDACGILSPVLIGHSDGATIALLHAARHPVRGVVSEAAHVFVEERSIDGVDAALAAWRDTDLRARLARYHGDNVDAMFAAWSGMWRGDWFRPWNIEAALPGITAPLLVLQGAADEYGTPAQVAAIERGVSGPCETHLLPDCGHAPHFQARADYDASVVDFLRRIIAG